MDNAQRLDSLTIQQLVQIVNTPPKMFNNYYLRTVESKIIGELERRLNAVFNLNEVSPLMDMEYLDNFIPCQVIKNENHFSIIIAGEIAHMYRSIIKECGFNIRDNPNVDLYGQLWEKKVESLETLIDDVESLTVLVDKLSYLT